MIPPSIEAAIWRLTGNPIETKASIDFAKLIADELLLAKQKEQKK